MFLINTFSRAIERCTSAAWSAVSWWAGSYFGCFLACAEEAASATVRKERNIFRNVIIKLLESCSMRLAPFRQPAAESSPLSLPGFALCELESNGDVGG